MTTQRHILASLIIALAVIVTAGTIHGRFSPEPPRPARVESPALALGHFTYIDDGGDGVSVMLTRASSKDGAGQSDHPVALSSSVVELLDYIHFRESRRGTDPRCFRGIVGPAGERGEYQLTPPFTEEVKRLGGSVDVYDNASCKRAIVLWMDYWAPKRGAESIADKYELFRRGPTGFRQWKQERDHK